MPRHIEKALIASTSSIEAAAMTNVGIPWSIPYPLSDSDNKLGTTTAGDTAANTNLQDT